MNGTTLRVATQADAPAVCEIYAPAVTESSTSFEMEVPSTVEMARRIAVVSAKVPWLVAERKGEIAGYAYAGEFRAREAYRWTLETSVYVGKAHHRVGVGRALMLATIEVARALKYRTLVAGATLPNEGSEALHLSLGFELVGTFPHVGRKNGAWHDVGFWSLDLGAHDLETMGGETEPLASLSQDQLAAILSGHSQQS